MVQPTRSRPRVLFVVETNTDVRFVEGLAETFDLKVIGRGVEGTVQISQTPALQVDVEAGPAGRLSFARYVWSYLREKREDYQFVIVHEYGAAALAANVAGAQAGVPVAMLVGKPAEEYYRCRKRAEMDDYPFRAHELAAISLLARLNGMVGRHYVVVSNYLGGIAKRMNPRARVDVIPAYGVDTDYFKPTAQPKAQLKAQLGLPVEGHLVFFSSRIAPEKDVDTLLRAVRLLLDRGEDVWLLNRSGGYEKFLEEAAKHGIAHRAIGADAVHPYRELPQIYQASDLCVQASRQEGLGMSPLEALACGVPVVASEVGGLLETVRDGETGWTYPAGNVDALANGISDALNRPEEAARRATAGLALVSEHYTRTVSFNAIHDIVTGALRSVGPSAPPRLETPFGVSEALTLSKGPRN